jgi:hypothetical protein
MADEQTATAPPRKIRLHRADLRLCVDLVMAILRKIEEDLALSVFDV